MGGTSCEQVYIYSKAASRIFWLRGACACGSSHFLGGEQSGHRWRICGNARASDLQCPAGQQGGQFDI